jgi:ATP-dependent Clp protease, protease subunit
MDYERVVYLCATINNEVIKEAIDSILELLQVSEEELYLMITSVGGSCDEGFGFYDAITKFLKPNLTTVALGVTSSIALIIFLSGKRRLAGPNTSFLLHDITVTYEQETLGTRELKANSASSQFSLNSFAKILAERSGGKLTVKKALQLMRSVTVLNAKQAKQYGLVHEILDEEIK